VNQFAQLSQLTTAELTTLGDRVYRGTMRLFGAVQSMYCQMSQMVTWTAEYDELRARSLAAFAAAVEQSELCSAITAELRDRPARHGRELAERALADRIGAALAEDDMMAEALLNEGGK